MRIGTHKRTLIVRPVTLPIPQRQPAPAPPAPVEREKVPV